MSRLTSVKLKNIVTKYNTENDFNLPLSIELKNSRFSDCGGCKGRIINLNNQKTIEIFTDMHLFNGENYDLVYRTIDTDDNKREVLGNNNWCDLEMGLKEIFWILSN